MTRTPRPDFVVNVTSHDCDLYEGTAAALVREQILQLDQLPGQPGRPKTRVSYYADGSQKKRGDAWVFEPGEMRIRRTGVDRFLVRVVVPALEFDRRRAIETERREKPLRIERARTRLAEMVTSPQHYRERSLELIDAFLRVGRTQFFSQDRGAFCIDTQSLAAYDQAAAAVRAAVQTMGVSSSTSRHDQNVADICSELGISPSEIAEARGVVRHLRVV